MEALTHWDDLQVDHHELGPMNARWRTADGARVGMSRIEVAPGRQSTPAHVHTAEEELFYVLGGSGLWWEGGATTAVGPGDVMFAKPRGGAHTIIGGDDGIDVLAFGPRRDIEVVHLPRPGVLRIGGVATIPAETKHQWFFEAEAGPVERIEPSPRPANVAHIAAIPAYEKDRPGWEMTQRLIGRHLSGGARPGIALQEPQQLHRERQHQSGILLRRNRNNRLQEPQLQGAGRVRHRSGGLGQLL